MHARIQTCVIWTILVCVCAWCFERGCLRVRRTCSGAPMRRRVAVVVQVVNGSLRQLDGCSRGKQQVRSGCECAGMRLRLWWLRCTVACWHGSMAVDESRHLLDVCRAWIDRRGSMQEGSVVRCKESGCD